MKKAAILAAALAMVLTLAACGNRDDNNSNNQPNDNNATTDNGNVNGSHDQNGTANDNGAANGNGTTTGNGATTGSDPITGSNGTGSGSLADDNDAANRDDRNTADDNTMSRSRVGNDLRRAADDVGDAVTGMVDGTRSAVTRGTSTTTFQRMLDNARVHDMDGVLADGENSRW